MTFTLGVSVTSGRTLGPYSLVELLGRGGGAEVWEAFHREHPDTRVAVKLLQLDEGMLRSSELRRFEAEIWIGYRLRHPNIVPLIDHGQDNHQAYFVMELLKGASLSDLLAGGSPLAEDRVLAVFRQALEALAYVHELKGDAGQPLGLIHRDVKPSNLFIAQEGTLKVIDFGIAQARGSDQTRTRTGVVRGSLPYCSPEQVRNEPLDARSDLFSLGLVLYEMLTGARCFRQEHDAGILGAILWSPIPPVAQLRPEASPRLAQQVESLIEKDRDRRPSSAREVLETLNTHFPEDAQAVRTALVDWAKHRPAQAMARGPNTRSATRPSGPLKPPVPPAEVQKSTRKPRRRTAWIGALAVVVVGLGLVWGSRQRPPVAQPTLPTHAPLKEPPPQTVSIVPAPPPPAPAPQHRALQQIPKAVPPSRRRPPRQVEPMPVKSVVSERPGWLTVGMQGGWARIQIDATDAGPTPVFRFPLAPGRHTIVATRKDGRAQTHVVTVRPENETTLGLEWNEP